MEAMEKSTFTPAYSVLRAELVRIRQNAGFSQRELATHLKVAHSWVAKVESGERRLDFIEMCWFFSACGVEPLPVLKRVLKSLADKNLPSEQK
jgi:transcriptional regulator with XRE-family HTH domain